MPTDRYEPIDSSLPPTYRTRTYALRIQQHARSLSINTRLDLHSSPAFPPLFLHSPLCMCECGPYACFFPPRSRAHIQFLIYRSNQYPFLSYLSSMPDPPTKPPDPWLLYK